MNDFLKKKIEELRRLDSNEAAAWLISSYPIESVNYGDAIALLGHRSWKKEDQIKLANYYFQKLPFATSKPYEVFSSFMTVPNLVRVICERLPEDLAGQQLLAYHLTPVLTKQVKSLADEELVRDFLSDLSSK